MGAKAMTGWEFVGEHPVLTVLLALIAESAFSSALNTLFALFNRGYRVLNIRKNGWPPSHCDADGDFRKVEEERESHE